VHDNFEKLYKAVSDSRIRHRGASFLTKSESEYHKITIDQSIAGINARFGPETSSIYGVAIAALSHTNQCVVSKASFERTSDNSTCSVIVDTLIMSIGDLMTFDLIFATFLPSYELWIYLFGNPSSVVGCSAH